jgi:predicted enzyme related to lactoylglutathione lyase
MKIKKTWLLLLVVLTSATTGYVVGRSSPDFTPPKRAGVTGIGGIFFKSKDPATLKKWYDDHLGFKNNQYGTIFEWRQAGDSTRKGYTLWAPFKEKSTYFPGALMVNFRINDMDILLTQLKEEGIYPVDSVESVSYGKFVHIMDPEGNKIELWQPNDIEYEKLGEEGITVY